MIGLWASRYPLGAVTRFSLALGLSVALSVLWEIGEYTVIITSMSEMENGYPDTIGDLTLGLIGSGFGGWFALHAARPFEIERPASALALGEVRV